MDGMTARRRWRGNEAREPADRTAAELPDADSAASAGPEPDSGQRAHEPPGLPASGGINGGQAGGLPAGPAGADQPGRLYSGTRTSAGRGRAATLAA